MTDERLPVVATRDEAPVTVVVRRRMDAADDTEYAAWQKKVGAQLATWPGFLSREVIPPAPPQQVDWIVVEHFRDLPCGQAWVHSDERSTLVEEVQHLFIGDEDVHILTEETPHPSQAASALISSRVPDGRQDAFLSWQRRISAAEARFDGFVGHRVERPVPGVQDDWVVIVSFDSPEHLEGWLSSPERQRILAEGEEFAAQLQVTRASYGFGFWAPDAQDDPVFKSNLLVLLMLYPLVFLWGYFVSEPLIDSHGVPFWLSLFIGNVVSTQLLGWFLVPFAFRRFRWWMRRGSRLRVQVAGYAILAALYAVSMAVFAWLGAIRG